MVNASPCCARVFRSSMTFSPRTVMRFFSSALPPRRYLAGPKVRGFGSDRLFSGNGLLEWETNVASLAARTCTRTAHGAVVIVARTRRGSGEGRTRRRGFPKALSCRFAEFESTLRRILVQPLRWHPIAGENRKLNFDRFPYAIVYRLRSDCLFIVAVMHLHREPFYWAHREPA